ncbi:MAG: TIGR02206 family membrane protein [Bacilli bacterium]|nr:TIGR02206 family membrane protein [Bacilli bacterium]MDD4809066.1 TIGR02206 family membrane protein [Bacilli bacterium]
MREFFVDELPGISFELFGLIHFACLLILIGGLILIYINRHKISNLSSKTKKRIVIIMIVTWLLNRFIYMGSYLYYGIYIWRNDLPLHFCFITGYLFIYSLIFKKKEVFKIVYFFAFMGPFTATIWPNLTSSFDYFIFYEFFISHHFFVLCTFFIFYMHNIKIKKTDLYKSIVYANIVFLGAFIFNNIFNTNYIMSESLPEHVLMLYPFLRNINYPIVVLEITALIITLLAYIPVYLKNTENKHLHQEKNLL